jgi:hypothetical protein
MKIIKKLRPNRALILNKLICEHIGVLPFTDVEIEDGKDDRGAYLIVRRVDVHDDNSTNTTTEL